MTTKRKATGIKKQTFRSAYNLGNEDYSQSFNDGLTEQHHTDTCDINKILAQFMETGIMPQTNANPKIRRRIRRRLYTNAKSTIDSKNTI